MATQYVNLLEADDPIEVAVLAEDLLNEGQVVVFPTETVYGAAARLDRPAAVERLRAIRGGAAAAFTPHVASPARARQIIGQSQGLASRMMRKLWPGPVALTFDVADPDRQALVDLTGLSESELFIDGTITLRCPDHPIAEAILDGVEGPVALARVDTASGADPFTPSIRQSLSPEIAMIIDSGPTRYSKPSTIARVRADRYDIVRAGVFDQRIIDRLMKTTVLFVCSGNTCRSPMAAALARKQLRDAYREDDAGLEKLGVVVASAGTFAAPGMRATPQAVDAVAMLGGELSSHRSTTLTPELIHQADHIFTMGRSHAQAVMMMSPGARDKVQMLDPEGDVDDPIGSDLSVYQSLARTFQGLIARRLSETVLKSNPPAGKAGK
jgi:L-threonylcarbamoyladenylate synthase